LFQQKGKLDDGSYELSMGGLDPPIQLCFSKKESWMTVRTLSLLTNAGLGENRM